MMSLQSIRNKLSSGQSLRILFINDLGFQYGAGLALLRQIQSFLLMGHDVAALCWTPGAEEENVPFIPAKATGSWLGMSGLPYLHSHYGVSQSSIIDSIVLEASLRYPDVIILGNLHGAGWSLKLLPALQSLGCVAIAFLHDFYLITGRCAYPGECHRYEIGCNDSCPTWDQYPSLAPDKIFDEWVLRREIFCGSQGVPLAANSQWTLKMARQALTGLHYADCVYYGLDEQLFRKIDKSLARQLLGIPQDCFVILGGAVNMSDYRKGGHIFCEIVSQLQQKAHFVVFGAESHQIKGVQGTGLLRDYRKMVLVYSAADIFVGTSLEEAFGQTFCEAAACSLPVVAFNIGGIPEIARHDVNARLANEISAQALLNEIDFFMKSPAKCQEFGRAGRAIVEQEFTLKAQGERWIDYLKRVVQFEKTDVLGVAAKEPSKQGIFC
ncbi:glycosyltransferase [Coleofasciculus sp. FACHB-1120]|uniref:glycosyltransferase n=1 Tax=Coleofasciculus sp. FACHB-1120 TaxID=2692783 RepID=UPI001687946A|nr:glycosyltransferase [Coleofasciculus sp. FACHB-1120]MBD2743555.1 glycosyltransferase [Coleofasciculus sp. FACHB-1120]